MQVQITARAASCNAGTVLIEQTASGVGLIQLLRERTSLNVIARQPQGSKEDRLLRQEAKFEAGRVYLPKEAHWLADFERELLTAPNGKYDDQLDALTQLLEWVTKNRDPMCSDIGIPGYRL